MVSSARLPGGGRGSEGEKTGGRGQREEACQEGLPSLGKAKRGLWAGGGGRRGPLTLVVAPWQGDGEGRGVGGPMKVGEGCEGGELLGDMGEVSGWENSDRTSSGRAVLGHPVSPPGNSRWHSQPSWPARHARCGVRKDLPWGSALSPRVRAFVSRRRELSLPAGRACAGAVL